jgi:hypothetical protein
LKTQKPVFNGAGLVCALGVMTHRTGPVPKNATPQFQTALLAVDWQPVGIPIEKKDFRVPGDSLRLTCNLGRIPRTVMVLTRLSTL